MSEHIHQLLEGLPSSSLTTRLLGALDFVVPGEWTNVTNFEAMIREVSGEDDPELVQRIGERALALYADPEQGYQRAVQIYRLVDDTGAVAGALSSRTRWANTSSSPVPPGRHAQGRHDAGHRRRREARR
ncbi:MAG: hypothetical protein U0169_16515 [Polyangiaceae bacterium]